MGRTLSTATKLILDEQKALSDFRRALRKQDQLVFDALFARAMNHSAAIAMAAHALPFETILLAMLLEESKQNQRLAQKIELLEKEIRRQK